jgi:adenylate cyclase
MSDDRAPALTRRTILAQTAALAATPLVPARPTAAATPRAAQAHYDAGMASYRRYTAAANAEARTHFLAATAADPHDARAHALLGAAERQAWTLGWTADRAAAKALALQYGEQAVALARQEADPQPSLPSALVQLAFTLGYRRSHDAAEAAAADAVRHRPTYADGWAVWGQILAYRSHPEAALEKMTRALALHPAPPVFYGYHVGLAHYVSGVLRDRHGQASGAVQAYRHAAEQLRTVRTANPDFRPGRIYLAATLWALGHQDEAHQEMEVLDAMGRIRPTDPAFAAVMRDVNPYEDASITDHLTAVWQAAYRWQEVL